MPDFDEVVEFYINLVNSLKNGTIVRDSPLDLTVVRVSWGNLAYIDNRRDAKENGYDFWKGIDASAPARYGISQKQLYSESQEFPDFVFKAQYQNGHLTGGTLLETKDTAQGAISSFNSTIPTATKSLQEIDALNDSAIVSHVASVKDGSLSDLPDYYTYQRRCFYLIRTNRGKPNAKTSLVDGSFFETVSKNHLLSEVFLHILEQHEASKKLEATEQQMDAAKKVIAQITDQSIIASSQSIEKASLKPRLRIMAEVNPEGNPHNQKHYPQIQDGTINLVVPEKLTTEGLKFQLHGSIPGLAYCTLQHKRNGRYAVFQFKPE